MAKFTLDTSGAVCAPHKNAAGQTFVSTLWSDLSPFAQGYVEAMFAELFETSRRYNARADRPRCVSVFSDLAPSTLAAILKDCGAATGRYLGVMPGHPEVLLGAYFWHDRRAGNHAEFPPLTLTLRDDGKVYMEPRA